MDWTGGEGGLLRAGLVAKGHWGFAYLSYP